MIQSEAPMMCDSTRKLGIDRRAVETGNVDQNHRLLIMRKKTRTNRRFLM